MKVPLKNIEIIYCILLIFVIACNNKKVSNDGYEIPTLSKTDKSVQEAIEVVLESIKDNKLMLQNEAVLYYNVVNNYYQKTEYAPIWCSNNDFTPAANNFVTYLNQAALQGLFADDYNFKQIKVLHNNLQAASKKNIKPIDWAQADVTFTNAFMAVAKDLKQGRLVVDSLSWRNDTAYYNRFFGNTIEKVKQVSNIDSLFSSIQPKHQGYVILKSGIKAFVDSMDTKEYTYVNYPFKDSTAGVKALKVRLTEAGITITTEGIVKTLPDSVRRHNPDSIALSHALKTYQKINGLVVDGKVGAIVIKKLNTSDKQRYNSIAITLDRYKLLPEQMPQKYIWVNLPGYYLNVYQNDTLAFTSKVIVGKQATPTPTLTAQISDMVLYPTWTVPSSIISKDMLPGLKRNSNYLARRGLYLLNGKGAKINASAVNWGKYTKGIPFRIQQGSGNSNALGVIKFNFENPYSVYLHDTNQRYLFKNGVRALSHGCVRVQEWQKLANYIAVNDSLNLKLGDTLTYTQDSIMNWMAEKRNRRVVVKNKMPLFITYYTCELQNGKIKFFDDIYFDDRDLKQKYFANK